MEVLSTSHFVFNTKIVFEIFKSYLKLRYFKTYFTNIFEIFKTLQKQNDLQILIRLTSILIFIFNIYTTFLAVALQKFFKNFNFRNLNSRAATLKQ